MHKGINKRTEEFCKKASEIVKKLWQNPEYREKQIKAHKGKKHSEETKRKIGKGNKGKKLSRETIKKLSVLNKGRKHTKKSRKNMSIGQKKKMKNPILRRITLDNLKLGRSKNVNTKIELKLKEQLEKNNIKFKQQYELGKFTFDFYLPKYNLLIEADGVYWHNYPYGNENDKKKDIYVKENGYNIVHIWENEINKIDFNIKNYLGGY